MKIKLDIENKILFPLLALVVIPIIVLGAISYYNASQMVSERQLEHMEELMDNIEVIYEKNGNSLDDIELDYDVYDLEIMTSAELLPLGAGDGYTMDEEYITTYRRLDNDSYLVLGYDRGIIALELFSFQKNSILIAIVSMLASAQIIIILAFNISRPIKKLTETCVGIEEEKDVEIEDSYRKDELGVLNDSFGKMMRTINQNTEKIEYLRDLNAKIIEDAPIALFLMDEENEVYKTNRLGEGILSRGLGVKDDSKKLENFIKEVAENDIYTFDDGEGNDRYLDIAITSIEDFGKIVSIQDITKRKEMESRMDHMNKLSSLGNVAASLAHEIRNPLSGIRAGIQVLGKRYGEDDSSREIYEMLIGEVDRLNYLINDILNYSKPGRAMKVKCDYMEVLESSFDLYRDSMATIGVKLELENNAENTTGYCDPNQMKQIYINIITNALNAMDKREKKLKVSVANSRDADGNEYINITFKDNGKGIKKEDMEKIFDPFYTSYEKGVGLGLSVVKNLVNENGGRIKMESVPGQGTDVKLKFEVVANEQDTDYR
ncbi:HAMP domain-containing protein [Dethiosulfatibacter aminovorans DSM 17477]|uniref:histidine kinase n=1 Tax=Dethiosulfatibacter aminovorans DSM 17477 TaxID=1121476 RepID=A0A1M6HDI5_9FIRM|nr:ATP-binding protein [Dethiosulfatibacter aminovorans]SHJ20318.1 HAMP domain-containing protein [Dethiosulfatibacter aminovorans DSM 17477]